jgi:type IV pilus assembly protein PilW
MKQNTAKRNQRGFSLVELMVAMVMGLIVVGGTLSLLANSRKNYTFQDSVARLQENARFAVHVLTNDLRMAGYFGCADDVKKVFNHVDGGDTSLFGSTRPLEGFEQGGAVWYPTNSTSRVGEIAAGTDAITVRYMDGGDQNDILPPYMPTESAALHIAAGNGLVKGDIVAVSDCSSTDIFQITGPTDPNGTGTLNHNTGTADVSPGNFEKDLSKTYEGDAFIMKLVAYRYYIAPGANGNPSLFREALTSSGAGAVAEELVEGIENMQILYGVDTINNDRVPDIYRPANLVGANNWDDVVAVRVVLLAYTIAAGTGTGGEQAAGADVDDTDPYGKKYDLGFADSSSDKIYGSTGNRRRERFVATVMIRNVR